VFLGFLAGAEIAHCARHTAVVGAPVDDPEAGWAVGVTGDTAGCTVTGTGVGASVV